MRTGRSSAADHRPPVAWWAAAAAVVVALGGLVAVPIVELARVGVEEWQGGGGLDRAVSGAALFNTMWTGAAVAVLAVAAGTGAAFVTERMAVPGRRWLRLGIVVPIVVPGFVSALSWARAYGPGGLTDDLVGWELPGVFGAPGVVAVVAVNAIPIAYVIAAAALRSRAEPDLERAARAAGAGRRVAAATVTLPLLAPALLGAAALTFIVGINAFGVPAILGTPAGFGTVTTRIYQDLARSASPAAFSRAVLLALLLVAIALAFVAIADRMLAGLGSLTRTAAPAGPQAVARRSGIAAAIAVWLTVGAVTVVPLVALILVALTRGVGLAPVPSNWTLGNFAEALDGPLLGALGRSLLLAAAAATAAVALGALVAALQRRRAGRLYAAAVLLTFAVPGSTLAVAVLLAYGGRLRDTLTIILIAYVAKLWGVGHRTVAGSAAGLPPDLYRAARAAGASAWTAVRTVVAPQVRPALVAGWLLVFLFALHELTMSSLLHGPGTGTLAVEILDLQQLGDVPVSAALATLLTVPPLVLGVAVVILAGGRLLGGAR